MLLSVAVCCRALQCVVVCCSVLQCVVLRCSVLQFRSHSYQIGAPSDESCKYHKLEMPCKVLRCFAVCCSSEILFVCALYVQYSDWKKSAGEKLNSKWRLWRHWIRCNTLQHINTMQQYTATHCNALSLNSEDAVCRSHHWQGDTIFVCSSQYLAACCSALQYVAVCCSLLQSAAVWWCMLKEARYFYVPPALCCIVLPLVALWYSVWRRHDTPMLLPVSCSVL